MMKELFGRPQIEIFGSKGHQETWTPWGILSYHIYQCNNEIYVDEVGLSFKVDNNFGQIGTPHEEPVCNLR